jgi:type I restriction enzyme S subunit
VTLNIDRDTWTRVKFGDVVTNVNVNVKDPAALGIERVVGLEHLVPGELAITRWASTDEETTFTRRVRPGQTLFGKRRAYQRKTAYAEFAAICSGDILIFEPKDQGSLLPELLPFVASTDAFYKRALETSAGSLSPRTRWSDLAKYEFDLPPIEEQKRIVDLLWAAESYSRHSKTRDEALDLVISEFCRTTYRDVRGGAARELGKVAQIVMGRQKAPKYMLGLSPQKFLSVASIGHLELSLEPAQEMDFSTTETIRYCLRSGDILVTEGDLVSAINVGRPAIFPETDATYCFQNTLLRLRFPEDIPPMYALTCMEGMRISGVFAGAASTTTVTHLGLKRLAPLPFPLSDAETRRRVAEQLESVLAARAALRSERVDSAALRQSLLKEVL